MATQTSTVPLYLRTLRDRMAARFAASTDFTEVGAFAAPAGDPYPLEMLELFNAPSHAQEWAALGNRRRRETYSIDGMIGVVVPGSGEDVADAARERAYAILAELEDELRRDWGLSGVVLKSQLAAAPLAQDIAEEGRWAALRLRIDVETELTSS